MPKQKDSTKRDKYKSKKKKENKIVQTLLNTINDEEIRTYRGNPLLKRAGEKILLTKEHIKEIKKCRNDPVYFAEKYIKIVHVDKGLIPIQLYDYQKRILQEFKEHRFNILLSCRQSGKCCCQNTINTFRHPNYNNGEPFEMSIVDFYAWQKFRNNTEHWNQNTKKIKMGN